MHTILHDITVVRPVVSTVALLGRFCLPNSDGSRVKTVTQGSPFAGGCCQTVAILRLKCDRTREGTRFRLSAKRTSPFNSTGGVSSVDYWQPRCAHQRW